MIPRQLVLALAVMLVIAFAMTVYVWRMRKRAAQIEPAAYTQPVAAPPQGPTEEVTLYIADDDAGTLRPQAARIPLPAGRQERAEELLRALLGVYSQKSSSHPLAAGADVREVYLVDPGLIVIDTNSAFADGHRSGVLVEELTIASMIKTLAANISGLERVKILAEGKRRDTLAGHADLSGFYDVSAVNQLVGQIQE